METPHIHAEVIKAWADGAKIQYRPNDGSMAWCRTESPMWSEHFEYRVEPPPHQWQKEMDAMKEGKEIQFRYCRRKPYGPEISDQLPGFTWKSLDSSFSPVIWDFWWLAFRIKPRTVTSYYNATEECIRTVSPSSSDCNLILTFEDGKLVQCEMK